MKEKIIVLTEADEKVASGHLKECTVLIEELQKAGYCTMLWVNEDIPKGFLKGISAEYVKYHRPLESGIVEVISYMEQESVQLLIFNLRRVDNEVILKVKKKTDALVLCIDELGHRRLDCDIIINPMIDESFGQYEGNYRKKFLGGKYLILPIKYHEWNREEKKIKDKIEEITISMGGVDINNTTGKIVNWLQEQELDAIKVNVVLGGGYTYLNELKSIINSKKFFVFQNIDYLDRLFFNSDIAFCAGGNTLHELACIGTSAIVIPTMPHEYQNGKTFENKGFGRCYRSFEEFILNMEGCFFEYFNKEKRFMHMMAGKFCSDGFGYLRVLEIVQGSFV